MGRLCFNTPEGTRKWGSRTRHFRENCIGGVLHDFAPLNPESGTGIFRQEIIAVLPRRPCKKE